VALGIHDGQITELQLRLYLAYVLFFPTLSAGPIDRYRRFVKDLARRRTRDEYVRLLDEAVHAFFMGVLYKFVLAVIVRRWWLDPVTTAHGSRATLSYMYAYSAYLIFDFAGYSAFAIAFSKVFAIRPPENFNQPWRARDLAEFWSRWHISRSTFLRDQVYMRFLMAARRRGWFAGKHAASAAGLLVSFGVMGVWHGAEWHYVVYGLFHGVLLIALEAWRRRHPGRRGGAAAPYTWRDIPASALTLQLVCVSFLNFSGRLF
jgi:membrane protein involved in D-alanine export